MRRPVAAALLVLAACAGSGQPHRAPPPPPGGAGLAARVITKAPPGMVLQPDAVADTGPIDLPRAATEDAGADAAATLEADGFVGGYERFWRGAGGSLLVAVAQFSSAAGARRYMDREVAAGLRPVSAATPAEVRAPSGIPGAVELQVPGAGRILLTRGPYLALVSLQGGSTRRLEQLAADEWARLGPG